MECYKSYLLRGDDALEFLLKESDGNLSKTYYTYTSIHILIPVNSNKVEARETLTAITAIIFQSKRQLAIDPHTLSKNVP